MQGSFSFPILFGYLLHQSVDGGGFGQILVLETSSPTRYRQVFSIDHSLSEIDGIDLNIRSYLNILRSQASASQCYACFLGAMEIAFNAHQGRGGMQIMLDLTGPLSLLVLIFETKYWHRVV